MSTSNQDKALLIAIITVAGTLGAALFTNWDKVFPNTDPPSPVPSVIPSIPSPSPSTPPTSEQSGAKIYFEIETDNQFEPVQKKFLIPEPIEYNGKFHSVVITRKTTSGQSWNEGNTQETWMWGYVAYSDKSLQAQFGKIDSNAKFDPDWLSTSERIYYDQSSSNRKITIQNKKYDWLKATISLSDALP